MSRLRWAFIFPLFPVLVIFWSIGWILHCLGIKRLSGEKTKSVAEKELELFVLAPQEEQLAKNAFPESL